MKVYGPASRREIMSSIKSSGNQSTEIRLMRWFIANNIIGWKCQYDLPGTPDFVFIKSKLAVFTDGCFWHGHDCRNLSPATNRKYWLEKIERNMRRDVNVDIQLKTLGWTVVRLWECELNDDFIIASKLLIHLD